MHVSRHFRLSIAVPPCQTRWATCWWPGVVCSAVGQRRWKLSWTWIAMALIFQAPERIMHIAPLNFGDWFCHRLVYMSSRRWHGALTHVAAAPRRL